MFQISLAIRRTFLAGAAFALAALLLPAPVKADSPSFAWTDSGNTSIAASSGPFSASVQLNASGATTMPDGSAGKAFKADTSLTCSGKTTKVSLELDVAATDYQKTYPTPAKAFVTPPGGGLCQGSGIDPDVKIAQASTSAAVPGNTATKQCDQGGFSWLACPLMDNISTAVTGIAEKALTPLLQVKPLSQSTTPGVYQAWNNIKHVAEVLFVFIFMAAIFSNALQFGLDQYTVKRILPRLVAAAIIIQFSFFISALLVDAGNVMGAGISDVILANFNTGSSQGAGVNVLANIGVLAPALAVGGYAVFANWVMILPILLMLLIGVIAILLTLAARYMLIAVLVALAPLAVLAWVLPNTEHHFKKWFTFLFRLILMYPLIIGVLAFVSRLTEILGFTDGTTTNGFANFLTDLIKPFLLIAALMVVPFAFKWAGSLMHHAHSTISGMRSKGHGMLRGSDWYQERSDLNRRRNIDRMKKFNDKVSSMKYLGGAKGRAGLPGRAAAGLMRGGYGAVLAGAPSTNKAIEKKQSQYISSDNKALNELEMGGDVGALMNVINATYHKDAAKRQQAMQWLQYNAPALVPYTKTEAGRMAVFKKLADMKLVSEEMMSNIAERAPREYVNAKRAAGKAFSSLPTAMMRFGDKEMFYDKGRKEWVAKDTKTFQVEPLREMSKGWDEMTIKGDLRPDNFVLARKEAQVSGALGQGIKYSVLKNSLSENSRTRAQAPKRSEIYKWLISRQDELEALGGNAAELVKTAKAQWGHNEDIHEDLLSFAVKGDPDNGLAPYVPSDGSMAYLNPDHTKWSKQQKEAYLKKWLDQL